jgi:hypothetical protein
MCKPGLYKPNHCIGSWFDGINGSVSTHRILCESLLCRYYVALMYTVLGFRPQPLNAVSSNSLHTLVTKLVCLIVDYTYADNFSLGVLLLQLVYVFSHRFYDVTDNRSDEYINWAHIFCIIWQNIFFFIPMTNWSIYVD